ncbi:hypothetical protein JW890_09455 [candidate division WOR-3 bacterium]|nr:hypothetical protein [candidate division WOR-3 bacterium]
MDNKNYRIAKDVLLQENTDLFEITIAAAREAKRLNAIARNRVIQLEEKPLVTAFKKLEQKELNYYYEDQNTREKEEKKK